MQGAPKAKYQELLNRQTGSGHSEASCSVSHAAWLQPAEFKDVALLFAYLFEPDGLKYLLEALSDIAVLGFGRVGLFWFDFFFRSFP